jgi:hypothetical protein
VALLVGGRRLDGGVEWVSRREGGLRGGGGHGLVAVRVGVRRAVSMGKMWSASVRGVCVDGVRGRVLGKRACALTSWGCRASN